MNRRMDVNLIVSLPVFNLLIWLLLCMHLLYLLIISILQVLSVKLDEWTNEQVNALKQKGGNTVVNLKYEAHMPDNYRKPEPDSSIEERTDFIRYRRTPQFFPFFFKWNMNSEPQSNFWIHRRKYEMQQFLDHDLQMSCPFPAPSSSHSSSSGSQSHSSSEKKHCEKQTGHHRIHALGHAFRNSWRRSEHKTTKKSNSTVMLSLQNVSFHIGDLK